MMSREFWADWCMDDTCLQTIRDTYKQSGISHSGEPTAVEKIKFKKKFKIVLGILLY